MKEIFISGFVGLVLGIILEDPIKNFFDLVKRRVRYKFFAPKEVVDPYYFSLGNQVTKFVVCDGDGRMILSPSNIETKLGTAPLVLQEDLKNIREGFIKEAKEQSLEKNIPFWNGSLVTLDRYVITRTDSTEDMKVIFNFVPSDYFTYKALNANLNGVIHTGKTIRETYLKNIDIKNPLTVFSNGFGAVLVVITRDGKTIFTKRSEYSGVRPGELDVSIVEAVHPLHDRAFNNEGPNLYTTAIRGAKEELGIEVSLEEVKLFGFGLDEEYYQWNIVGVINSKYTSQEIMDERSKGVSGKWELEDLRFEKFSIDNIVKVMKEESMWSTAKVALYWALINEYSKPSVDNKVKKIFK
ncbi:MAG: hypothetical protein RR636_03480 [Clostridium sp.]|uniref:hypothetical protein n=1 Tax=Clostridium sp. TaxID=1506 RepID=UPI0030276155